MAQRAALTWRHAATPWTAAMMSRFRGMTRGFCEVVAGSGFGFGSAAVSLRFTPADGAEPALLDALTREVLPAIASRRGMAGVHLLRPAAAAPMTAEQSLRGPDAPVRWLLLGAVPVLAKVRSSGQEAMSLAAGWHDDAASRFGEPGRMAGRPGRTARAPRGCRLRAGALTAAIRGSDPITM